MTAFWDISPCSIVEIYRRFRGAYCLNHQDDDVGEILGSHSSEYEDNSQLGIRRIVLRKYIDVSQVPIASIIMAMM
jgi:hypothetical protein